MLRRFVKNLNAAVSNIIIVGVKVLQHSVELGTIEAQVIFFGHFTDQLLLFR
jgi:hypothetical protein